MCHMFALTSGARPVEATFWLLDAPDTDRAQTARAPDGAGLAVFGQGGTPHVIKQPITSRIGADFAHQPRTVVSSTFVAHVRHASTGRANLANTHPFQHENRVFAHNGVIEGLDRLEAQLGEDRAMVQGDTDSERYFALINREIAARDGDVGAGIVAAVQWIAANLPLYSVNMVLATADELWALRYPDTNRLYMLRREPGGRHHRHLDHASPFSEIRARSLDLADRPAVAVESERMDEDPAWRLMTSGELLHVAPDLTVTSRVVISIPPAHQLSLDDLRPEAARSQTVNVDPADSTPAVA
ncbi:class II glutamine amidotransferase [Frankia sp. CNm7]|uniref:Class II glutamine amidotransferase n=1 Tax=Frankia nepalensis TaxID=1836974 RepID=A0A937USC1_9ACTN|nr:class II glutamine amidotransferase [Frankia nepalensis]MBL7496113.1 class II glutamine amidotransferase [Frankia nepalensis]MBL7508948.1 class II glutamine amidotransferase [Frankia nepalensis]MBL7516788.1 class II glutamine amidotransferase [Frankia nepalensis]MBL7628726.1 class II glutamine amidotransferase [Frankia nepalensis]